jgi:sugar-specific transcriptional regulator TrmB
MDTSVLEELGLTQSEITTYVTLLELGSAHAGAITERSGLPNSVLHRALNQLISKGLISHVQDGRIWTYQATKPEQFYTFLDEKRRRFTELLPELQQRQATAIAKENASVYKGSRGVTEVYTQLVNERAKEYNSFGGGKQCADRMGMAWWLNLHAKRRANKLPSRQVFDESVRALSKDITAHPLTSARFLPAEFASFQETVVVGDLVAITVFTENPYSFLLRDKSVAQSYKQYFELLWSQAKR